jgi:hypothetical protein
LAIKIFHARNQVKAGPADKTGIFKLNNIIMNKFRMAFMALAAISSVGGAFAFSPSAKKNATTYYAQKSGSSFIWVTSQPQRLKCSSTALNATCTITTANAPVDGEVPAGHSVTNQVYQ